ncbi:eCIS core domain-containing protein [Bradyrhizobium iriomotense]|uniref:eCIS core domain-containing protein n=1 Tax=Bradyrhizobium iriomotense TaxID=441950 RepID=A0ABQ6B0L3_9BRAD|nr:DUF4157 domain-containing protein [Bradyrhizobium iriomotense]GLR87967.1 hypothetical protein GCM10007857_46790 [Bradyrhizobium iriomotense]
MRHVPARHIVAIDRAGLRSWAAYARAASPRHRHPAPDGSACACGGTCPRCAGGKFDKLQPKLTVNEPGDVFEQEADRVADAVMRTPETELAQPERSLATTVALQRKESPASTPPAGAAIPSGLDVPGSGEPLHESDRDFFEPRFGRSFSDVRIHTGDKASVAAQSVGARAFTYGSAIVMGQHAYSPATQAGRALLAHELAHVVQQDSGRDRILRRQTIDKDCGGHDDKVLTEAWAEGLRLTEQTIGYLERAVALMRDLGAVPGDIAQPIRNTFGSDVGFAAGDLSHLPDLIKRYETIKGAFQSNRHLRCDLSKVAVDKDECDQYAAFVIPGNKTDVFICPSFFQEHMTPTSRGQTLLHELAHSALGIAHQGGVVQQFNCDAALGLEYHVAARNAYAYDILANCLYGSGTEAHEVTVNPPAGKAPAPEAPRWSISGGAGGDVSPRAQRLAAALGGQVSLRTGEYVVFNPVIGVNLLYLPSNANNPSTLEAATADIGLRIQQPLKGLYFDVSAGGFAGFDIDPARDPSSKFTKGVTATAGVGWRWQHLELGAQARALVPETDFDRTKLVVVGRAALLF